MPEYPDIENYLRALRPRLLDQPIERVEVKDLFVLRTAMPPFSSLQGQRVRELRRLGKRIVWMLDSGSGLVRGEDPPDAPPLNREPARVLVIHLMIAGRLRWRDGQDKKWVSNGLARWWFPQGSLTLTEAGTKRRAKIHLLASEAELAEHDPGGLEVLESSLEQFAVRLRLRNHTLKRALSDPTLFSGIGNAYSDEILHWARMSPILLTQKMTDEEVERLYRAIGECLPHWASLLAEEVGEGFPETVTAFHPKMAVHGRYNLPCPICQSPIQRISYADNETNYCARCQTGGRLLADRSLSRILKKDWPRSLDEL